MSTSPESVEAKIKRLDRFIKEQVNADEFSGAILITKDGDPVLKHSSGFANREKQIPNRIDTKFNIGSMDKMFTGVAIAQLAQRGKLNLQDAIVKYLPDYPKKIAQKITIHQILTHTEGFPSYFNDKYKDRRLKLKTVEDYLGLFKEEPLLFEPGEKYQYSNSGYIVLGAIIEAVTGQSYYDYVDEHVFKPANMLDTGFFSIDQEDIASGYTYREVFSEKKSLKVRRSNEEDLPFKGSPAGGGYSTCPDLFNFSQALLQNKLLSPKMTKLVFTPKVTVGEKEETTLYYGYGFQILDVGDGNLRYGHGGTFAGVNARLDIYPWFGYVVVVLSNYDAPAAFRIANEAMKTCINSQKLL